MTYYTCPICGFDRMTDAPEDLNICPCCGTEFGSDTYVYSTPELRARWIANGMQWFSSYVRPSKKWNPVQQLINANMSGELVERIGSLTHTENQLVNVSNHVFVIPIGAAA